MKDFVAFIREQGVIGLAIGFIMGGATSKVVTSFVTDLVQPVIGLIFGSADGLASMQIGPVKYGSFIATMIDFAIIAAVVYFGFKGLKLDALDKKKDQPVA